MRSARPLRLPQNLFYGWLIVAASTGIQLLISALIMAAFSSCVAVLRAELGWSKTLRRPVSPSRAWRAACWAAAGLARAATGPAGDGTHRVVMMAIGFMLFSQINSPAQYFLTFFLIAVGASLAGA